MTDIWAPTCNIVGLETRVKGTVENLGLTDESVMVYLKINGSIEDSTLIQLDSGESSEIVLQWVPTHVGTYHLELFAEITGYEPYTDNNQMNVTVVVSDECAWKARLTLVALLVFLAFVLIVVWKGG